MALVIKVLIANCKVMVQASDAKSVTSQEIPPMNF
jgi:hypothetical protein